MAKVIKNVKIGDVIGRVTVVGKYSYIGGNNRVINVFNCICFCGSKIDIKASEIGNKKSCGCYINSITHGKSHSKVWSAWQRMKSRCYNKNNPKYPIYGAAGRFVCLGLHDFKHFYSIIGEPPSKQHSLDRRDNDGSYTCGKCDECLKNNYELNIRWATSSEQSNNVSSNVIVEYKGEKMTLVNASRKANLPYKTVHHRISLGWSVDEALSSPLKKVQLTYKGNTLTQVAKEHGMPRSVLYSRVKVLGMTFEQAICKPIETKNRKNGNTK